MLFIWRTPDAPTDSGAIRPAGWWAEGKAGTRVCAAFSACGNGMDGRWTWRPCAGHDGPAPPGAGRRGLSAGQHRAAGGRPLRRAGQRAGAGPAAPDDGLYGEAFDLALGFRRLAILDLSPAGHQPMASPDGRYWLIFNGEIYNYLELRAELAGAGPRRSIRLRHRGDAGRLPAVGAGLRAALQRHVGVRAVGRRASGGCSCAATASASSRSITCRDRRRCFAFASEIKALLAAGAVPFHPTAGGVAALCGAGRMPSHQRGRRSSRGCGSLPAAHSLLVTADGVDAGSSYWGAAACRGDAPAAGGAGGRR